MLKNENFKIKYYSAGRREPLLSEKSSPQVNLVIPSVVNRLITVWRVVCSSTKHHKSHIYFYFC